MILRLTTLAVLIILAVIGIGPVPTTSFVCIYVVIFRPRWFKSLVDQIYQA